MTMQENLPPVKPEDFFSLLKPQAKNPCFLMGKTKDGWQPMLSWNPAARFVYQKTRNISRDINKIIQDVSFFVKRQTGLGRRLMGYLSYDLGLDLFDIKRRASERPLLPDVYFLAFDNYLLFNKESTKVYYAEKDFLNAVCEIINEKPVRFNKDFNRQKCIEFRRLPQRKQYLLAFKKIKRYIEKGDIYQVNLSHRIEGASHCPPRRLFIKAAAKNPVGFLGYVEGDGFEIISASPERFVRTRGSIIETFPIKGTRPRGTTESDDARLKKELLESDKEKAELNMVTDLLRNDLGKVCRFGSVKVVKKRALSKYPSIFHTYSHISGKIKNGTTPFEAMLSMFPGGSVTGCPKKRAMEIIEELEPRSRGAYCGSIGCVDPNGDIDFNVAIRTIIKKGRKIYLSLGGGIVYDSEPGAEFQETLAKALAFEAI